MANLLFAGALLVQENPPDVGQLLGSGRSDLWVFGESKDLTTGSVEVQLRTLMVPPDTWGTRGSGPERGVLQFSQRPVDWNWKDRPARQLRGDIYYHLSKYDDHSAFSPFWGFKGELGKDDVLEGAILRHDDGRLQLIANGLEQARRDYALGPSQDFLGVVGPNIFYFDHAQRGKIYFFAKSKPDARYEIVIPATVFQGRNWKLDRAYQVFSSETQSEFYVFISERDTAWISISHASPHFGVRLNLSLAKPVASRSAGKNRAAL